MTIMLRRSARVVLAALISGGLVWWSLVIIGALTSVASNLNSPAANSGPGLINMLWIGVLGMVYAIPISLAAGLACLPSALTVTWRFEKPGVAGPWTFALGGAICALVTALVVWLGIWAMAAKANPVSLREAINWLYLLLGLAVGGPVAGFIYWRLARRELIAAKAGSKPA